jgi:hypothetical protein
MSAEPSVRRTASALDAHPSRTVAPSRTPRPTQLSRVTNDPCRARASRNTRQGRRIADLYGAYFAALGSPMDAGTQASILGAAELVVAAEVARSQLLAGTGDIDAVIRLEGTAARALRRLGIRPGRASPPPTLAERAAQTRASGLPTARAGHSKGDP